jgi:nicotinamidase/pyrazinamidase
MRFGDSTNVDRVAMQKRDRAALLIVDVQRDFCAGGTLAVPHSDRVVDVLNGYIDEAVAHRITIYASRDWHPAVTSHFKPYGGPWPVHCVQGTDGAAFHGNLRLPPTSIVVSKGEDPGSPGYSALEGRTSEGKLLLADLQERGIDHLYVAGLATDYCVKRTVLAALAAGLSVTVFGDAIAGVDAEPGDSVRALAEMREKGAHVGSGFVA